MDSPINIIFLCYEARSGSTYLSSELEKHKDICVTIEDSLPFGLPLIKHLISKESEILYHLINDKKFKHWNICNSDLKKALHVSKNSTEFFNQIIKLYIKQNKPNASTVIYKMPIKPVFITLVRNLFPNAKFIHLYRDPRSVYASQSNNLTSSSGKKFSSNIIKFSKVWISNYIFNKDLEQKNPKIFFKLKYEEFILSNEKSLKKLLKFINVTYEDLNSKSTYSLKIPKSQITLHKNIDNKPQSSRINVWKETLNNSEIYIIQKICRKVFIKNEYSRIQVNKSYSFFYNMIINYKDYYLSNFIKIIIFIYELRRFRGNQALNRIILRIRKV